MEESIESLKSPLANLTVESKARSVLAPAVIEVDYQNEETANSPDRNNHDHDRMEQHAVFQFPPTIPEQSETTVKKPAKVSNHQMIQNLR